MHFPANDPDYTSSHETPPGAAPKLGEVAPVWHTVALVLLILVISVLGAARNPISHGVRHRLATYALTGGMELAMLGWVAFGLRLRKIPLRSLFGSVSGNFRSIVLDIGVAFAFWIGSMMILTSIALVWTGVETVVIHLHAPTHAGQPFAPDHSTQEAAHKVAQLAPTNGREVAGWVLLCLVVGVAEELVFRGYLQRQFTAWARGGAATGVVISALAFGAAHGYEGIRNMVLLGVFGALFSLLAIYRRSLRAGIFAHSWHDMFAGLMLALLHSRHVV